MFSGLSGLFSSPPPTRLTNSRLLAKLPPMMNELRKKVDSLKADADKAGAGSIDYLKYRIMDTLQTALVTKIDFFNSQPGTPDNVAEILSLVQDLHLTASNMLAEHQLILAIERSYLRKMADSTVIIGSYASVFAASALLPFATVATLISLYYVGPEVSDNARSILSTDTPHPASFMLLSKLVTTLEKIGNHIDPTINWEQRQRQQEPPPKANQEPVNNALINHDPDGHFEALLMRPDTPQDIFPDILKKHYQILCLMYHPDKQQGSDHTRFLKIKDAYEFLSDEQNRQRYCGHKSNTKMQAGRR